MTIISGMWVGLKPINKISFGPLSLAESYPPYSLHPLVSHPSITTIYQLISMVIIYNFRPDILAHHPL
jgi:hypothetical protein